MKQRIINFLSERIPFVAWNDLTAWQWVQALSCILLTLTITTIAAPFIFLYLVACSIKTSNDR